MDIFNGSNEKAIITGCSCRHEKEADCLSANNSEVADFIGLSVALFLLLAPAFSLGAELNVFRLTGVEGAVKLEYSLDDLEVTGVDGGTSFERRPVSEQEVTLDTRSYVFHPNLLEMELGGGMRFRQESLEKDGGSNDGKETLYSIASSFQFLRRKPYPFRLRYNQRNPTYTVGLADSLSVEEKNYGADFFLRQPLVTFPLQLGAEHRETRGEGRDTIIDDTTDSVSINVSGNITDDGTTHFGFSDTHRESASGSLNLPLQATQQDTRGLSWNTDFTFGENRNISFMHTLSHDINEQSNFDTREDSRFLTYLNWNHDEALRSFYRYNVVSSAIAKTRSTSQNLSFGASGDVTEEMDIGGTLEGSREKSSKLDKISYGFKSHLGYKAELTDRTSVSAGYNLDYTFNEQDGDQSGISETGERHALSGLLPATLANEFVAPGTVVVSNETRTQTFIENIDYRLRIVGSETRLERLLSGNIADGQTVLVDYVYETGGEFDYSQLNQSIGLRFSFDNNYSFYMSYLKREETLEAGVSARPLYSSDKARVGTEARLDLGETMRVRWLLELEKQNDELRPFTREAADLDLTIALPFLSSFANLNTNYEQVDNELSTEDVKLVRYGASISAQFGLRSRMNFDLSLEKDTGGEILREIKRANLVYLWQWRLLSFSLDARHSLEEQGGFSREDSSFRATLIRKIR
ncbi:MAG: hypothetical protein KZQ76_07250 [Candidatus Thiodiazotropha sp. (ex Epidulcina cf. delphinae)]|nr:hypothetical protein [Candidatus Thiodiazotropha sp. (ex Epidulcina cf. delphinae)]